MKILIYTEYFLPISGGVQTNVYELACGLSEWRANGIGKTAFDVTIVTRTQETTGNDNSWPFALVRRPSAAHLFNLIEGADLIHIAGPALLPMLFGLILRKPVVVAHHGYQSVCPNGLLLLGTDRTVCPGHFMAARYWKCVRCNSRDMGFLGSIRNLVLMFPRRLLANLMWVNIAISNHVASRISLPRTKTIPHGIRDPGYSRAAQNGKEVQIGYVGRLVQEKGLPLILVAAKRLSEDGFQFHLTFVGDGPLRNQLQDEAGKLKIADRVTFTGELSGKEFEAAVRPIQIAVMPSVCEETAGLAAIEQMMRGGLVVASDIGGLSEVVGDSGLKFTPGDPNALYVTLRKVLQAPGTIGSVGAQARTRAVQLFGRDTMIRAHVACYEDAKGHLRGLV